MRKVVEKGEERRKKDKYSLLDSVSSKPSYDDIIYDYTVVKLLEKKVV
jgi:hypothetical protein